jgi:serine/threonine protein kinase
MINWKHYDNFDWDKSKQYPMDSEEINNITRLAAECIGLDINNGVKTWGMASPPGRWAATVIQVLPGTEHKFLDDMQRENIDSLGLKIYKNTVDGQREVNRVKPVYENGFSRLPGLPNAHVQRIITAESISFDGSGERFILAQEWIDGYSLDLYFKNSNGNFRLTTKEVKDLLEQLYKDIIIPLWDSGNVWWDIRDANFIYNPVLQKLSLIDVDSLTSYYEEKINTPHIWKRRDKGREFALTRLRGITQKLLITIGLNKVQVTRHLDIWKRDIKALLLVLGKVPGIEDELSKKFNDFLQGV